MGSVMSRIPDLVRRIAGPAIAAGPEADVVLGEDGKPIEEADENYGGSVLIVDRAGAAVNVPHAADAVASQPKDK